MTPIEALQHISLCSQNSMSSKEDCGRIARQALKDLKSTEPGPLPEPVQRLLRYAGQTMRTARNPNMTAREAIQVGDWIHSMLTMKEAVDAADGTLHGAIDHWQERALKAEAALNDHATEAVGLGFAEAKAGILAMDADTARGLAISLLIQVGIARKYAPAKDSAHGWLPIETAPKGTREMFVVRGFNVSPHPGVANYTTDAYAVWRNDMGGFARWPHLFPPTHWMSLPPNP